jgi:UDP-N-acetylmuramate--alanine ligase
LKFDAISKVMTNNDEGKSFQAPCISLSQTKPALNDIKGHIHLVGIGGIGMSALARLLLAQGFQVSGSDKQESAITHELEAAGAKIFTGHQAENLEDAHALVISTAIIKGNPELDTALKKQIPIYHRSELLNFLAANKKLVAVTGTHGKTTTTAMVSQVLLDAGYDPSVVVGGIFERIGSNSYAGKGELFVAESDESDGTHATAQPYIALITNIEPDHLENYPGGFEQIMASMETFLHRTTGFSVLCVEDKGCRELLSKTKAVCPIITYGIKGSQPAKYSLEELDNHQVAIYKDNQLLGKMELQVPGLHNKLNALAALAIGLELGSKFEDLSKAIALFKGVNRRFQLIAQARNITIVDDYAHHPTEVRALLKAAQEHLAAGKLDKSSGRIVCIFQPHQPGRLKDLWPDFLEAFADADLLFVADVYIARGKGIEGVNSQIFVEKLVHKAAHYLPGAVADMPSHLIPHLQPNDLVLTVGAGDITGLGPILHEAILKADNLVEKGK